MPIATIALGAVFVAALVSSGILGWLRWNIRKDGGRYD